VLVANAARARRFVRDPANPANGAMRESASFVRPASRMKGRQLGAERSGHALKSESASTQPAPRADERRKEHAAFARELAGYLEEAAHARRLDLLAVFASSEFLGELRTRLGVDASKRLRASIALDLTAFEDRELEQRVSEALAAAAWSVEQPGQAP
jgi:protein required for attachment to host cells